MVRISSDTNNISLKYSGHGLLFASLDQILKLTKNHDPKIFKSVEYNYMAQIKTRNTSDIIELFLRFSPIYNKHAYFENSSL